MVFVNDTDIEIELYPDSDGKPMADNSIHYRWIVTVKENLEKLFADEPMVFVAGDMFWYPVPRLASQSKEERVEPQAPDVIVVFGVPKGDRGSYKQHEEGNIPPQVVFEIRSPSNSDKEMKGKLAFYQKYGVEECYFYDPDKDELKAWQRRGAVLEAIALPERWVSPRLGVLFDRTGEVLRLYHPGGKLFTSLEREWERADLAEEERDRERAEKEKERAEKERERAEKDALLEKLRAAGIDPDAL